MLVEFSIIPVDDAHMSDDVAKVVEVLEESQLPYRLGPMSTSLEGEWDEVMRAIGRCHQVVAADHSRVITTITLDDHRLGGRSLDEAISRVEEHLHHRVKQ